MSLLAATLNLQRPGFTLEVALQLPAETVTTISGPSGAGKTSLLRCIAGLERHARGRLRLGAEEWLDSARNIDVPPERRGVGYVIQEGHLFPHLSVAGNLDYAARRSRNPLSAPAYRAMTDALGLEPLLGRNVQSLSGGERQRVAIGRALAAAPRLLLLDEPVSALDGQATTGVLDGVRVVVDALRIACLYVSHDLREAARLAQHMLWMEAGRIVAAGPIERVLSDPQLPFAQGEDAESVIDAVIVAHEPKNGLSRLQFAGGELWVAEIDAPPGTRVRAQIAARDVSLARVRPEQISVLNILGGTVEQIAPVRGSNAHALARLSIGEVPLLARLTRKSVVDLALSPGVGVWALVKSVAILS